MKLKDIRILIIFFALFNFGPVHAGYWQIFEEIPKITNSVSKIVFKLISSKWFFRTEEHAVQDYLITSSRLSRKFDKCRESVEIYRFKNPGFDVDGYCDKKIEDYKFCLKIKVKDGLGVEQAGDFCDDSGRLRATLDTLSLPWWVECINFLIGIVLLAVLILVGIKVGILLEKPYKFLINPTAFWLSLYTKKRIENE